MNPIQADLGQSYSVQFCPRRNLMQVSKRRDAKMWRMPLRRLALASAMFCLALCGQAPARVLAATLSINDVTVKEGDAGTVSAIFTVTLSATSPQAVTVDYTTGNGTAKS